MTAKKCTILRNLFGNSRTSSLSAIVCLPIMFFDTTGICYSADFVPPQTIYGDAMYPEHYYLDPEMTKPVTILSPPAYDITPVVEVKAPPVVLKPKSRIKRFKSWVRTKAHKYEGVVRFGAFATQIVANVVIIASKAGRL